MGWNDWMEYVPIVSGVKNVAEGDWMDAAVGFTPFAPVYQGGKALYGSDFVQDNVLPMVGLKKSPQDQALLNQMNQTAMNYDAYRPQIAQARMDAMNQAFQLMSPYSKMMEQMYGPGAVPDYSQMQNPLAGVHMSGGSSLPGVPNDPNARPRPRSEERGPRR